MQMGVALGSAKGLERRVIVTLGTDAATTRV